MNLDNHASQHRFSVPALLGLALPLLFLALFGSTYFAWGDEVQFVDPAANARFGQGFTSMAWPYQTSTEFFAGNAPGYSILLVPWFHVMGFGLTSARAFNLPLMIGSGLLILSTLHRVAPTMPHWLRGLALAGAMLGAGTLISSGSARYDMMCLLVAAWIFHLLCRPQRDTGNAALIMAGVAAFYAGFHLAAALVVMLILMLLAARRRFWQPSLMLTLGLLVGLTSWLIILAPMGLFKKFFVMLLGSQHTLSGQVAKLVLQGDQNVLSKFSAILNIATLDLSLTVLGFLVLLLAMMSRTASKDSPSEHQTHILSKSDHRFTTWLCMCLVFMLPVALLILGKFPIYYTWMAYTPGMMASSVWAWRLAEQGHKWAVPSYAILVVLAAGIGIYGRVADRDMNSASSEYEQLGDWVRKQLHPEDMVYSAHIAYFDARATARHVLGPTYAQTTLVKGIPERDQVSAVLIEPEQQASVTKLLGGQWTEVARFSPPAHARRPEKLNLVLLRRTP